MTTRNDSKLEESIGLLGNKILGGFDGNIYEYLRAFAEAVRENEKCPDASLCFCECHSRPPEPKECGCHEHADNYCCEGCSCHKPAALPDEAMEEINYALKYFVKGYGCDSDKVLEMLTSIARLCLKVGK